MDELEGGKEERTASRPQDPDIIIVKGFWGPPVGAYMWLVHVVKLEYECDSLFIIIVLMNSQNCYENN